MGKTKTQKMRGSRSCGYGRKKRHRGKGNKGGSGMAGSKTHKIFKTLKENPNYFVHKTLKKKQKEVIINLRDLKNFKENKIDLRSLGYTKLLGIGEIERKVEVIINKWSKTAEEKIRKMGGIIRKPKGKTETTEKTIKTNEEAKPKEKKVKKTVEKSEKKSQKDKESKN